MTDEFGAANALAIEDYAFIGDCRTGALVGNNGSIDWLCWPRFDSDACFAALLGDERHGRWLLAPASATAKASRQYGSETMILETVYKTSDGLVSVTDFMPMGAAHSSVIRIVEGLQGSIKMRMHLVLRFDYGSSKPWVTPLANKLGFAAISGPHCTAFDSDVSLDVVNETVEATFDVCEGQRLTFALTWGPSHLPPPGVVDAHALLAQTEEFWRQWAARCTYQREWRPQVMRSLLTLKALTFQETGGIVAAPTTSLPEQLGGERNWDYRYCWLRDASLTLAVFAGCGYEEEAAAWQGWLQRSIGGDPATLQIMYGVAGERRLPEWSPSWLPGYQQCAPVRIGNAAADQMQIDVFGEIAGTLYMARNQSIATSRAAWETGILHATSRIHLGSTRRRHLGGTQWATAVHLFQSHGMGGVRPRHSGGGGRRSI